MRIFSVLFAIVAVALLGGPRRAAAQNTCAKVEIVIEQTLTLEREGFEARLEMENGTPEAISNFTLTLRFSDENAKPVTTTSDPNAQPTDPNEQTTNKILFFHRYLPSAGESSPPGNIPANGRASYKYLIVPTIHAAKDAEGNEIANGRLYYVGATITYTQAGQTVTTEVSPDFITVRPMPNLELEYFLPGDVFADDPLTTDVVEAIEPFPLGVRVVNHSAAATAKKLRIESAQPRITKNDGGLLIDFKIIGSEVNGLPATPSLLANFGDIAPERSAIGSWVMTTSLSGRFTAMSGEVSHAPEFGGALTSLIPPDAIKTYRLLGRVKVTHPNSDNVPDFLATSFSGEIGPQSIISLHASDNSLTGTEAAAAVVHRSSADDVSTSPDLRVTFNAVSAPATLSDPDPKRFYFYARIPAPSPYSAGQIVTAVRVGGQALPVENAWISKHKDDGDWHYTLNLFDCLVGAPSPVDVSYDLTYATAPTLGVQEPVITFSQSGAPVTGTLVVAPTGAMPPVTVAATDDGPLSMLQVSVGSLPYGAQYNPSATSPGGVFEWPDTPSIREPQTTPYEIVFRADDGINVTRRTLSIRVVPALGGGYDAWKATHWPAGTPESITGEAADPDHDEIPNLMEYALLGNPTIPDDHLIQPKIGRTTVDGRDYLTLSFIQRDDDPLLNVYVAGASNAFAPDSAWVAVGTAALQDQLDNGASPKSRTIKIRDNVPLSAENPRRYLRLIITR